MAYLYILHSKTINKYYIGSTDSTPQERLKKHLTNHSGFTAKAKDWEIVYTEEFQSKTLAMRREKLIKSWKSRQQIEILIGINQQ